MKTTTTQTKLLSTEERSEIMSRAMKTWWANRKAAEAKAERKAKREAKKAAACTGVATTLRKGKSSVTVVTSGVKVKLPRGTQIKDGKVKMPSRDIGRTKPQIYASKTKRTYRKAG